MENLNLVPNKSVGMFILGDDIKKYLYLPHIVTCHEDEDPSYKYYDFHELSVDIWVKNGEISTIACDKYCYWQGKNLIKMPFEQFLSDYKVTPDKSELLYTLVSENRGQNQMVYDFDELGLMLWVWRKKIVTVLVSNYHIELE